MEVSPEILVAAVEVVTERRRQALAHALMLVANNRLPAWSAFDFAFAVDRFLTSGLPPRDTITKPVPERRRPVKH